MPLSVPLPLLLLLLLLLLLPPPGCPSSSSSPSSSPPHPRRRSLCPVQCVCHEASDLVDCAGRGLSHAPAARVPRGTWLLDLSGNRMTTVRTGTFTGLWSLRILLLANNSMQGIEPQSLSLRFLERLDLSFNELTGLPHDFSQSLSALEELRLDHNLLTGLSAPALSHFHSMRTLDLSHNHILTLEVGVLSGLSRLVSLNLEANGLSAVPEGLWARQQRLEVLLLGHNNLTELPQEALAPLRSLSLLGLQGNRMERLNFKALVSLHTLSTHVQLSLNPWICDCELHRVFAKLQRVRHLQVEDYGRVRCHAPAACAGRPLASLDGELCMAETAAVLGITCAALLAGLAAAMFKAHRSSRSRRSLDRDSSSASLGLDGKRSPPLVQ